MADVSRSTRVDIYTDLMRGAPCLSKSQLLDLHQKRGLVSETLADAGLFRACPEKIPQTVAELRKRYSDDELDQVGILRWVDPSRNNSEGHYEISKTLVSDDIVIPYLDSDRRCIYLRIHKVGPTGVELEVYGQHILATRPKKVVITEGEYKALALNQCDIPSLAIPGVSSFAGKGHFERLVACLTGAGVSEVVILFDNEIKNDPSLPGYKSDPMKRWDTDYWACQMAQRLYKAEGIASALIARLPDEWRIRGKIDPDAALAAGRTPAMLRDLIDNATIESKYAEWLPNEGRVVLGYRAAERDLFFSPLKEEHGIYKWKASKDAPALDISNFVFLPGRQIRRANGQLDRIYTARNKRGEQAECSFEAKELAGPALFKQKLLNAGPFRWSGDQTQLDYLQERLFGMCGPKIAHETECYGRLESGGWAFGDGIIDPNGTVHALGDDGVVWGNSLDGIIPLDDPLSPKPMLATAKAATHTLTDIHEALSKNLGTPGIGLGLGWVLACVFSDDIFAQLGNFPILGIVSGKGSGKTVCGRWLTGGWGLGEHSQNPLKLVTSTAEGLDRTMAKYSSMPVWVDEYRNDLPRKLIHTLRSIYDRSGGVKGVKSNDNQTRGNVVKACLLLSGEEIPNDPALVSRIVLISLSKEQRQIDAFASAREAADAFPAITLDCIKRRAELLPIVMGCIQSAYEVLQPYAGDERLAWAYAVPLGAWLALLPSDPTEGTREGKAFAQLLEWLKRDLQRQAMDREQDDHLSRLWIGMAILTTQYEIGGRSAINRMHVGVSRDGHTLFVWLSGVYARYAPWARGLLGDLPFSEPTLRSYCKEAQYIISGKQIKRRLGGDALSKSCIGIDLQSPHLPTVLRELADKVAIENWDQAPAQIDDGRVDDFERQAAMLQ